MPELLDCAMASKSVHNTPVTFLYYNLFFKPNNSVYRYDGRSYS